MDGYIKPIWIEKIFKRLPLPYPISSLSIGVLIYIIYRVFSVKVAFFSLELYNLVVVAALSLLISLQLVGIEYFLDNMEESFEKIGNLYSEILKVFNKSALYYLMAILVIAPFIAIEIIRFLEDEFPIFYYSNEQTYWAILLDIYNNIINYVALLLLSTILFIIFSISSALNKIELEPNLKSKNLASSSKETFFEAKRIRNVILKLMIYYFIIIFLLMVSFITPFKLYSYEAVFLALLLLVGTIFVFLGLKAIKKISKIYIEKESSKIDEIYEEQNRILMDLISKDNCPDGIERLKCIMKKLEILDDKKRIIRRTYRTRYYITTTITGYAAISVTFLKLLYYIVFILIEIRNNQLG